MRTLIGRWTLPGVRHSPAREVARTCPVSRRPISKDALTLYRGHVLEFCSAAHRYRFQAARAAGGRS